ncbi:Proton-dependent oligopeptide transporter family [Sesbania bispinosa]|nr:Proton-dependent oligopeptide transporter family [Sesbania bispinosa]
MLAKGAKSAVSNGGFVSARGRSVARCRNRSEGTRKRTSYNEFRNIVETCAHYDCAAAILVIAVQLGTAILALTAIIKSLWPHPCNDGSNQCESSSEFQYAVLYVGIALVAIGFGGARFTKAALGANQFERPEHQGNFFNWYFFTWYFASVIALTGLVYVEDEVSWALGFGICGVANLIGVVMMVWFQCFLLQYQGKDSVGTVE